MSDPRDNRPRDHERSDLNGRGLIVAIIGMLAGAVFLFAGMGAFFFRLRHQSPETAFQFATPPPPRLQADPGRELRAYLDHEKTLLQSYGWVDRSAGIARLPIERAMELELERGKMRSIPKERNP
jgi:hypothetical protein